MLCTSGRLPTTKAWWSCEQAISGSMIDRTFLHEDKCSTIPTKQVESCNRALIGSRLLPLFHHSQLANITHNLNTSQIAKQEIPPLT